MNILFSPDISSNYPNKGLKISVNSIETALSRDELVLHYQPKIDLHTLDILGFEALVRWKHPEYGLLMPNDFLYRFEEVGLYYQLDQWVFRQAARDLNNFLIQKGYSVAVNMSPQSISETLFPCFIRNELDKYSANLYQKIEIEILECCKYRALKKIQENIKSCRKMGLRFSLDDFGTGCSSLSRLQCLSVDTIKVDRSFICSEHYSQTEIGILKGVLMMCHEANLNTVVEGVETAQQFTFLRKLGYKQAQGYKISKPITLEEVTDWANQWPNSMEPFL
ncbi:EAL domain-containing protein [Vibrio sp. HN007]|uniref:EAL domain-containing protein n=1 Tax=Vibrio iocasae TaxID=3098914 RepID=UPI0035D51A0C